MAATTSSTARDAIVGVPRRLPRRRPRRHHGARLRARRRRRGAPPVPRRRRPRLAGRRRAADPRPGEGRLQGRQRGAAHGPLLNRLFHGAFAVGKRVRTRDRARRGRGVGQLRGGRAGAEDLRRPQRQRACSSSAPARWRADARCTSSAGRQATSTITQPDDGAARRSRAEVGGRAAPWDDLDAALGRSRHRHDRDRRSGRSSTRARVEAVHAAAARPAAVPHRHRGAARRRAGGRRRSSRCSSTTSTTCRRSCSENLARRGSEIARAEAIVDEEVARFTAWLRSRGGVPTVVALRQRFEAIRQAELDRLRAASSPRSPPEARARVDEITRLIVEKLLLRRPSSSRRSATRRRGCYADALSRLFALDDEAGPRRDAPAPSASRPARSSRP